MTPAVLFTRGLLALWHSAREPDVLLNDAHRCWTRRPYIIGYTLQVLASRGRVDIMKEVSCPTCLA